MKPVKDDIMAFLDSKFGGLDKKDKKKKKKEDKTAKPVGQSPLMAALASAKNEPIDLYKPLATDQEM